MKQLSRVRVSELNGSWFRALDKFFIPASHFTSIIKVNKKGKPEDAKNERSLTTPFVRCFRTPAHKLNCSFRLSSFIQQDILTFYYRKVDRYNEFISSCIINSHW